MTSFICMQALRRCCFGVFFFVLFCFNWNWRMWKTSTKFVIQRHKNWPKESGFNGPLSWWTSCRASGLTNGHWLWLVQRELLKTFFGDSLSNVKISHFFPSRCLLTLYILLEFDRGKPFHPASTATDWNAGENVSILLAWRHPPVSGEPPLSDVSVLTLRFYPHCSRVYVSAHTV